MARQRRPAPPFERVPGGVVVRLDPEEREMLASLLGQLRDLLLGPPDEPLLQRTFPVAYHLPTDAEADAEYQRLMRDELVASRLASISTVVAVLADANGVLDEPGVLAFMQTLNALRLVLGTMLDVSEDEDIAGVDDDDPFVAEHHLYGYLSYLLDSAVDVLTSAT